MAIIATGSKTIIDLSDGKSLSAYLGSNMPRIQILNVDTGVYSPSWPTTNLVITPVVYANQTQLQLTDTALVITWQRKAGTDAPGALITGETVSNKELTVNVNVLGAIASGLVTYIATLAYTDPDTGLVINALTEISFALVKNGTNAKTAQITGDQVFKYNTVGAVSPSEVTLTTTPINSTFSIWKYKNGSGVWTNYPTGDGNVAVNTTTLVVRPAHTSFVNSVATIGSFTTDDSSVPKDVISIYKVADGAAGATGETGASAPVVFLTNENVTFAGNVSGQVAAITVLANVVAYSGTTKVTPTVGTVTGAVTGMTVTKLAAAANEIPIQIVITDLATLGGAGAQQGVLTVPITTPVVTTLYISWSKVNTGATGTAGANAKDVNIGATAQVFKSIDAGANFTPDTIVLTPALQNVTYSKWQYSINGGTSWVDVVSGTTSGCTIAANVLTVAKGSTLFTASITAVSFKVITNDAAVIDVITLYKVQDGLSAVTAVLSNEAHTLPKTTAGVVTYTGSGTTIRVFEGATELDNDGIGTAVGKWKVVVTTATGITAGAISDSGLTAVVADHSAMGGNTASILYTISGVRASGGAFSLTRLQTFSIALQGSTGIAGVNAVVFSLYAPDGNIFTNRTTPATLQIVGAAYDGQTLITTGATYQWWKYSAGSWGSPIAGQTASTLTVVAADVVGTQSYRCTMTYATKAYTDTITLIDKTDNFQLEIDSSAGDVFKNTQGTTTLTARLWQNGVEIDLTGTTYTYKWYRRDKDGNAIVETPGPTFATGKTVVVDQDDVTIKTVFICEVE